MHVLVDRSVRGESLLSTHTRYSSLASYVTRDDDDEERERSAVFILSPPDLPLFFALFFARQ